MATTGSNLFKGDQTISGSIIPAVNSSYDLGSPTNEFRHLYLSSASLYIDGTKVLGSTTQELQITTDTGQSFKILEAGSDTITLQAADGNITLATSGGGDVILDPTSGVIALKGTTTLYAGNKILSSDGNAIQIGNSVTMTGSLIVTGFIETQELRTTYISSSILYRSGSTKFGDELTDTHSFTGSLSVSGSISVPESGLVSGSSQITYSGLSGVPSGIISGSAQLPSGLVSGSSQVLNGSGVFSGSAQLPSGIVSSSAQTIANLPSGTVSGSSQILNGTGFVKTSGASITYDNSTYLTTGTASSTYQTIITNPVTGTGQANRIPKWTSTSVLSDSVITDNGTNVRVTNPFLTDSRLAIGTAGGDQTYASVFVGGAITTGATQYAIICDPQLSGTGDNYAVFANARIKASTAVTNTFGVYIPSAEKLSGASIVNNYALYIANQTAGSTINYSIYSSGGLNYFGGATTFNSSVRAASLSMNVGPTSDRILYISANLPTTGTSQFQSVMNGTFVNAATTLYGMYVGNNTNVNVTNSYAIYIETTGGSGTITNKYGIYQSSSGDKNYFAGSTGVGTNNPSSIFHVVVPETASNLSGVRIQGDTNNKLLVLGANATYTWIQSHGSVPLRLNELGNDVIMGLGANVSIGISSSIGPKLDVRSSASYSSAYTQPAFFGSNDASGPLGVVIQTISGSGNAIRSEITSTRYGVSGNDLTLNRDSGAGSGGLTVKYQGNVGVNDANPAHNLDVNGNTRTQGTAMIGGSVGLLQFAMDGTRFNSYGFSHVHIKTSILKGSDTMISFNLRGYFYSPNTIDTDMAFYNYNPVSYVYSPTAHVKAYGGLTITMYYSSDNYVCICVEGLGTYGGFALNWINTSLIQWGGRVFALAWSRVNTSSAQY